MAAPPEPRGDINIQYTAVRTCGLHPNRKAIDSCSACGRGICNECNRLRGPRGLCAECFQKRATLRCPRCGQANLPDAARCINCPHQFTGPAIDYEAEMRAKEKRLLAQPSTPDLSERLRIEYEDWLLYGYRRTRCALCGRFTGTVKVEYSRSLGFVVGWYRWTVSSRLCEFCNLAQFLYSTLFSLVLGWWSPRATIVTAGVLAMNVLQFGNSLYRFVSRR
jgi:hypothetical protein